MPITSERPGIFRGTKDGRTDWYAADPACGAEVEAEWKANWAGTNRTQWQWFTKWMVFVGTLSLFVAAIVVPAALAASVSEAGGIFIAIIGVIGGLVLGGWLAAKTFPRRHGGLSRVPGVVAIPLSVLEWADDTATIQDIWELSVAIDRTGQVIDAAWHWSEQDDAAPDPFPAELVEDVIRPALLAQWSLESKRLSEVAARVGYVVPDKLREIPNPLAPAPQS